MPTPDVERLLKRPVIKKPHEEFILAPPPLEAEEAPTPLTGEPSPVSTETAEALLTELREESIAVQELIDLVIQSAEDVLVEVPEQEHEFVGQQVRTRDYLDAVQAEPGDYRAERVRQAFEYGLLSGECGRGSQYWPLLAIGDMVDLRDTLLSAAQVVEGTLFTASELVSGSPTWGEDVARSHLTLVNRTLVDQSAGYRAQFYRNLATMNSGLEGEIVEALVEPLFTASDRELRQLLRKLRGILNNIHGVLCHSQLLMGFEVVQVRDALLQVVRSLVLKQLLDGLLVITNRAIRELVQPIYEFLENGFNGSSPLDRLGDLASQSLAGVLMNAAGALVQQYNDFAADLLRQAEIEHQTRLKKLKVLGERNVVGRWIQHLDQGIILIDQLLFSVNLSDLVVADVVQSLRKPPPARSKLFDAVQDRPEVRAFSGVPFEFRNVPYYGRDGAAPAVFLPDQQPATVRTVPY